MRLFALLIVLTASVFAVRADIVLEYNETFKRTYLSTQKTTTSESAEVIFVADDAVRLDKGSRSYIYRRDIEMLWIVDRKAKTYVAIATPVKLENAISLPAAMKDLARFSDLSRSVVNVTPSEDVRTVGPWMAHLWNVEVIFPLLSGRYDFDIWITRDITANVALLEDLKVNYFALLPTSRDWYDRTLGLGGVEVMREAKMWRSATYDEITRTLVSIRDKEISPDHDDIPEGFTKEDFRADMFFSFGGKKRRDDSSPTSN